jgi:hypothetical protein
MMRHSGSAAPLGQRPELTWPEVWQYQANCVDLLVAATNDDRSRIRERAGEVIIRALTNFVAYGHSERGIPHLRQIVDRVVAGDLIFNANQLAERLPWSRYALRSEAHGGPDHNAAAIAQITELLTQLSNSDYWTRMRLWVGGWSLDIEDIEAATAAGERAIAELAGEACAEPRLLTDEIIGRLCAGAEQAGRFWHELGRQDEDRKFEALARDLATRDDGAHGFMLYVVGWCERNSEEGRSFFDEVAGDGGTSPRAILFGALEIDPPDLGAERIVQLIRENRIEADRVVGRLQGRWLRGVSEAPLVNVLELVAGSQLENSGQIPALLEMRLHGRLLGAGTLADFAWRCLEAHPTLDGHMRDYHSDHLAGRLASLNPDRGLALLERCMVDERPGQRWKPFVSGPNRLAFFWKELCRIDRQQALSIVLDVACRGGPARWTIPWWLPGLVDIATDADFLLTYAGRGESEALTVCEAITWGRHGFWPIVFGLIERHPSSQRLRSELELRIMQSGQVRQGPLSELHRQWLADVEGARQLPEATPAVRAWLDDFSRRLRLGLDEQLRREADERVNRG